MRYLEHVTTDGERWDNLAGAITPTPSPTSELSRRTRTLPSSRFYPQVCG